MTSYEAFIGRKPRVDHFKVFGAQAWVFVLKEKRKKLDVKSEEGVIVGCLENSQYKVRLKGRNDAIFARDVRINESCFPGREWFRDHKGSLVAADATTSQLNVNQQPLDISSVPTTTTTHSTAEHLFQSISKDQSDNDESLSNKDHGSNAEGISVVERLVEYDIATPHSEQPSEAELELIKHIPENPYRHEQEQKPFTGDSASVISDGGGRYPRRNRAQTQFFDPSALVTTTHVGSDSDNVIDALSRPDATQWSEAIKSEMSSLQAHSTWSVVQKPENVKILPTRFVFIRKTDSNGVVSRYKERLLVKGHLQGYVEDTLASVVEFTSVCVVLTLAILQKKVTHQIDYRTAFQHGVLEDDVYVSPPNVLDICDTTEVLKLHKGLYGLKQAPKV